MPHTQRFVDFRAVKAAVNIEQILDHYGIIAKLTRKGDSLSGPCPIHNGSNPTQFRVSLSKNCWNCFGDCKRGGNVLDFVALKERISTREAALRISEWFHLSFEAPRPDTQPDHENPPQAARQADRQRDATTEENGPNKPLGFQLQNIDAAHPYLTERGLSKETIGEFGLGYCAKGSMNGRIVIPIHNPDGKLLAYAGRCPGEPTGDIPKYKLPPGFRKSQEMFNVHRAMKTSPDEALVIVEGFFDCIVLWQQGLRRVVALMGSTLSPQQAELIRKITHAESRIVVMFDEDDAGRAGREQALQCLAQMAFVKAVRFENEGQQPGDLSGDELSALFGPGIGSHSPGGSP